VYDEGISREGDLLDLGVEDGIVEKSGSWYSYAGERIGQGRENARRFLKENADACTRLTEEVYASRGLKLRVPAQAIDQHVDAPVDAPVDAGAAAASEEAAG
jgi:recombination protein RecA